MKHNFEYFCKEPEKIENYQKAKKDNFKGWDCHHRLETHNSDGERRLVDITVAELQALRMYYNRPPEELIFLTSREHSSFNKGKKRSDEAKKKMSEAKKGEKNPSYGKPAWNKGKPLSAEHKKKIGELKKGNTNTKGKHWYNNGKINTMAKECPEGFVPGVLR